MSHENTLLVIFVSPWQSWNILTSVDREQSGCSSAAGSEAVRVVWAPKEAAGTFSPFPPRQSSESLEGFHRPRGHLSAESHSSVRWCFSVLQAQARGLSVGLFVTVSLSRGRTVLLLSSQSRGNA